MAVGAAREDFDFFRAGSREDSFHTLHGFVAGDMGEPGRSDDVPCRINALDARLVAVVRFDVAAVQIQLESFGDERADPDGNEGDGSFQNFVRFADDFEAHALVRRFRFFHFRARQNPDALFGQGFFQSRADFFVFHGEDFVQHFHDGDICSVGVEKIGELNADSACADDDNILRLFGNDESLFAADHAFSVKRKARHFARNASGGNQNIRRFASCFRAVLGSDFHGFCVFNRCVAADVVHLVFFEKRLDPPCQVIADPPASSDDFVPVVFQIIKFQSKACGVFGKQLIDLRVFQESFCRDATPIQAGAPRPIHLHARDFFAKLGGTDSTNITSGTSTNNNQIVRHTGGDFSGGGKNRKRKLRKKGGLESENEKRQGEMRGGQDAGECGFEPCDFCPVRFPVDISTVIEINCPSMEKPLILILCTGNSCRSQMAEGIFRVAVEGVVEVASAGSKPAGYVHPKAVEVMGEIGVDLSGAESKSMEEFFGREVHTVITVCGNADQVCPVFPGQVGRFHWGFDDPAHAVGSEEEVLGEFRRVRDEIGKVFRAYAAGWKQGGAFFSREGEA